MTKLSTDFKRGNLIESSHRIKALVSNLNGKILVNTGNENDLIFPRSSIKIFQALPFVESNAINKYKLNSKIIALSCSSHRGENYHIRELENWIKKIGVKKNILKCGIHYPLNIKASEKLIRSKNKASELHNNCAGKHLAMITSCLVKKYNTSNYLSFHHPHQVKIREVFEKFTNKKISKKNFGIDGCSAPQYCFKIKEINKMLINLIKSYNNNFYYSNQVKNIINSVIKNPKFIGGSDSLDSKIMEIANSRIFCKGGAEGVFLFIDIKKGIAGVVKVEDGNERAIPSFIYKLFKKIKIMNEDQLSKLRKAYNFDLVNHAKIKVGSIETKI